MTTKVWPEGTKFAVKVVEDGHTVRWAIGDRVEVGRTSDGWRRGIWPDRCAVWSDVWRWRKEVAGSGERHDRIVYVVVAIPPPRPKPRTVLSVLAMAEAATQEKIDAALKFQIETHARMSREAEVFRAKEREKAILDERAKGDRLRCAQLNEANACVEERITTAVRERTGVIGDAYWSKPLHEWERWLRDLRDGKVST